MAWRQMQRGKEPPFVTTLPTAHNLGGEWLEKHTLNVQRHRPTEAFAPWRWTPGVRRSQSDKVMGWPAPLPGSIC